MCFLIFGVHPFPFGLHPNLTLRLNAAWTFSSALQLLHWISCNSHFNKYTTDFQGPKKLSFTCKYSLFDETLFWNSGCMDCFLVICELRLYSLFTEPITSSFFSCPGSCKPSTGDFGERIAYTEEQCMEFWNCSSWVTHRPEESWCVPPKGREKLGEMEPPFSSWRLPLISDHRSPVKRSFPGKSSQNRSGYCTEMSSERPIRKTHHEKYCRIAQEHSGYEVLM